MIVIFRTWVNNHSVGVNPEFVACVSRVDCNPPACDLRVACKALGVGEFDTIRVYGTVQEIVEKLNGIDNSRD